MAKHIRERLPKKKADDLIAAFNDRCKDCFFQCLHAANAGQENPWPTHSGCNYKNWNKPPRKGGFPGF